MDHKALWLLVFFVMVSEQSYIRGQEDFNGFDSPGEAGAVEPSSPTSELEIIPTRSLSGREQLLAVEREERQRPHANGTIRRVSPRKTLSNVPSSIEPFIDTSVRNVYNLAHFQAPMPRLEPDSFMPEVDAHLSSATDGNEENERVGSDLGVLARIPPSKIKVKDIITLLDHWQTRDVWLNEFNNDRRNKLAIKDGMKCTKELREFFINARSRYGAIKRGRPRSHDVRLSEVPRKRKNRSETAVDPSEQRQLPMEEATHVEASSVTEFQYRRTKWIMLVVRPFGF
jgi:hypothetical protein